MKDIKKQLICKLQFIICSNPDIVSCISSYFIFLTDLICRLERESACYFDMEFFEDLVLDGKWDKVEKYLSSFTNVDDNKYSTKIYFEIRKLNFLEALDK